MSRFARRKKPPTGFTYLAPTLEALEQELKDRTNDSHEGKSKSESLWPIHQINWQKSRYVYYMFYKYKRIDRPTYDYCLKNGFADKNLIAKWKKPGYEKLCSTFVINTQNFPYGTVSICRVPKKDLILDSNDAAGGEDNSEQASIRSDVTGCLGCASGKGGAKNIFGNKYGQNLARIQVLRERREQREQKQREELQQAEKDPAPEAATVSDASKQVAWLEQDEQLSGEEDSTTEEDEPTTQLLPARKKQKT